MKHSSIKLDTPIEFVNITPLNPLISKCQIKVCYVGEDPNRNGSIITKEVAKGMANSLPGSPIVGYFNEAEGDFEEHNRVIDISNGKFEIKDTTRPYGFVDLNAKVWFQKFLDDGQNEHEYLMTEGYLWTGQYEEARRIIEKGNNQSMELDEKTLDATWTKSAKDGAQFFIINEAIISKLCVLGEDVEPCFEGATITNVTFSFEDGFKEQLFSMMKQVTELLKDEGGTHQMFTTYAVEIGDALWYALSDYLYAHYPAEDCDCCSKYRIEGIYEEGMQKFAILSERKPNSYVRLNFALNDATGFEPQGELIAVEKTFTPIAQFALEDVEKFETEYMAAKAAEGEEEGKGEPEPEPTVEEPTAEPEPENDPEPAPAAEYSLEDIPEYAELQAKLTEFQARQAELEASVNALTEANKQLEAANAELTEFKLSIDRKAKEDMINNTFFMLSAEDKEEVVKNIDMYSLDEIEAKLAVICVRNKVNFNLDEENNEPAPTVYNLDNAGVEDEATPAWVQAVMETAKHSN